MNNKQFTRWVRAIGMIMIGMASFSADIYGKNNSSSNLIAGDFWKADVSKWGDGRAFEKPSPKHPPHGFDLDWQIQVPHTGWYELYLRGGANMNHDVFVDGECQWRVSRADKSEKAGNLYLTAGKRTLKIRRVGRVSFPIDIFDRFELIAANDKFNACIQARKTDVDVMRVGEQFKINITAGGIGKAVTYTLLRVNHAEPKADPAQVGQVTFEASDKPSTKSVSIDCPKQGAFFLFAKAGSTQLLQSEFKIGDYAVVDVNHIEPISGKTQMVAEIDCINQTLNGKPIAQEDYIEANGPTRIVKTALGKYRESHDCTPPYAPVPKDSIRMPNCYSGFSYRIRVPEKQVPYLLEVDFPDDTRRSVVVIMTWVDDKTGGLPKGSSGYQGKSYETGGRYKLTRTMQTHTAVSWSGTQTLLLSVMSQEPGTRAAAARIRLKRFDEDRLPATQLSSAGKRNFYHWFEEGKSWVHLVGTAGIRDKQIVNDMLGMDRWIRLAQFYGCNGIQAFGVAYQDVFWRTELMDGFWPQQYDRCRLMALFCEKYGMKYMLEIFGNQSYFTNHKIASLAKHPLDIRPTSVNGILKGAAARSDINALHTGVQNFYVDVAKEINRKLGDSPAFAGVTARADVWMFHGDFTLPSLYWGYNDWTIDQFEKDTGIKVPGDLKDSERFAKRFGFLTASSMRDRWINWRCERILAYHKRFRDALAGDRDDVVFGLVGAFGSDSIYELPKSLSTRALEAGVDLKAWKKTPGLIFMPCGRYGSRSSAMQYQKAYDGFLDRDNVRAGMSQIRGFAAYMNYLEQAREWPARKLGINLNENEKPPYFCSAALAAGRHSLEKYAVVLAEQDTTVFRDGGNTDIFGSMKYYKPWFDTFSTIPAMSFTPLDESLDQLAIWHGDVASEKATKSVPAGHYFYAVNRTPEPVSVVMTIQTDNPVMDLGEQQTIKLEGYKMVLNLPAYGLKSFRTTTGTRLGAVIEHVPAEKLEYARQRLAFAQTLKKQLDTTAAASVTTAEKEAFSQGLNRAWQALANHKTWRAVTELSRPDMFQVYNAMAKLPQGMIIARFSDMLQSEDKNQHFERLSPMIRPKTLSEMLVGQSDAKLVKSEQFNPEWRGENVLTSETGTLQLQLDIPADGPYVIHLGQISLTSGSTVASVDGAGLATPAVTQTTGQPERCVFPPIDLKQGKVVLTLRRQGQLGVYGLKVLPVTQPMASFVWSTAGPFKSRWGTELLAGKLRGKEGLVATFSKVYPPQKNPSLNATYQNVYGQTISWKQDNGIVRGRYHDWGVGVSIRTGSPGQNICFAQCTITSDRKRTAIFYLPVDWWATASLNGKRLKSTIDVSHSEMGYDFTTHTPSFHAVLELEKGENTLFVKQLGGSLGTSFCAYITDDEGLTLSPVPTGK